MRSSLRSKLIITFLLLMIVVGAGTLFALERTLADDLVGSLDARMTRQGEALASWLATPGASSTAIAQIAAVTGLRITIIGADGSIEADSADSSLTGRPIGDAPEIDAARNHEVGRASRELADGEAPQYLVAVATDRATPPQAGRVVRVAVPLGDIEATRARMRKRLLFGGAFAFVGCLLLSWIFIRAVTRPLQSMTRTAVRLAKGDYDVPPPADAGGELGVLARAMSRMVGEVKARVSDLTAQRDLLRVVFGGLVEGVAVVDRAGDIVIANEAARPLLLEDSVLPPELRALVKRALAGEQADQELELNSRNVRASARPLGDPGAIIVLYDVTRMRALEAVRREFLSNAAHELRTPVTSIAGYAETLLGGSFDTATTNEFLETIHRNAERISGLVNDLVLLDTLGGRASMVVGARVSIALHRVVGDAAKTARGVTPTARVDVEIPRDIAVLGTRDALDHVFQNLIDNAIKYGGNTPVIVRCAVTRPSSDTLVTQSGTTLARPDRVRVEICDSGPGIPKGQEERIFERFYRVDPGRSRDHGGSGLGLAIVRSQVESLGGRVWVEHGNPGARFIVELERAVDLAATPPPE